MTEREPAPGDPRAARWALMRDLLVLQLKLAIDALRDVVLSPVSLVAGVAGLLAGGDQPRRYFRGVLALGRRTEAWIDLFGTQSGVADGDAGGEPAAGEERLDAYVARLEAMLVAQAERDGLTGATRRRVDRLLDAVQVRSPGGAARRPEHDGRSRAE